MQKEMNVDTLPPAIVHEDKNNTSSYSSSSAFDHYRARSGSTQSNSTDPTLLMEGEGGFLGVDPEILKAVHDMELSDSPVLLLRKKIGDK